MTIELYRELELLRKKEKLLTNLIEDIYEADSFGDCRDRAIEANEKLHILDGAPIVYRACVVRRGNTP